MIELNNGYYIDKDPYNFVLKKKAIGVNKKTKEKYDTFIVEGYYPNIDACMYGACHKHLRESEARSLEEMKDILNKFLTPKK